VQKTPKGFAVHPRGRYKVVDDKGDEIGVEDVNNLPEKTEEEAQPAIEVDEKWQFSELKTGIQNTVKAMESLSPGVRFSPCTTQDLLAHQIWMEAFVRVVERHFLKIEASLSISSQRLEKLCDDLEDLEGRVQHESELVDLWADRHGAQTDLIKKLGDDQISIELTQKDQYLAIEQLKQKLAALTPQKQKTASKTQV
jgi:hypothetical protein